jgi:formate dehydrogenase maturation protein FdhE
MTDTTVHPDPACPHCGGPADYVTADGLHVHQLRYGRCASCARQWIEGRVPAEQEQ